MSARGIRYAEGLKVLPVLAPVDTAATAVNTSSVNLNEAHWITFLVQLGNFTSDSTDTVQITVESSTADSTAAGDTAQVFNHRLASAVATDNMGAISTATSSGVELGASSDDDKLLVVDVDPAVLTAADVDANFVKVVITPSSDTAILLVDVIAVVEPRYPGNSMRTAT